MSKLFTQLLKGENTKKRKSAQQDGWTYVGRFLWRFAAVAACVDELFVTLFNIQGVASSMFIGKLDTRTKIALIAAGLKHQGIDIATTKSSIDNLHDVRNVIAHAVFNNDPDGVTFDYVNKQGERKLPNKNEKRKNRARTPSEREPPDMTIAYAEFDLYDAQMSKLAEALEELLASVTPITDADVDVDLASEIEAAIRASDIWLPQRLKN